MLSFTSILQNKSDGRNSQEMKNLLFFCFAFVMKANRRLKI